MLHKLYSNHQGLHPVRTDTEQIADRRPADPALAGAHAGAGVQLHLARLPAGVKLQLLSKHLFTAYQNDFDAQRAGRPDSAFDFLCETGTEVNTRVKINEDTKTVVDGALWTEESLPSETILAGIVQCDRVFGRNGEDITPARLLDRFATGAAAAFALALLFVPGLGSLLHARQVPAGRAGLAITAAVVVPLWLEVAKRMRRV